MVRRRKNEWLRRRPNVKEVRAAQKLARKVSKRLLELMESREIKGNE